MIRRRDYLMIRRTELFDDEESALDAIIRDAVPHYPRLADRDHVLKIHNLPGRERCIRMRCAETALAVVQQSAGDFLMRWIVERKFQMAVNRMAKLGTAISGCHNRFLRSFLVRMHRFAVLPPFRKVSASGSAFAAKFQAARPPSADGRWFGPAL